MRVIGVAIGLVLITLLALLPRALTPEYRGTEGRRVQIALEMERSGDYAVPTLGAEQTLAKPPLFYWSLAALRGLLGDHKLVARLPALIGFFGLALVAFLVFLRRFDPTTAWVGAVLVLTSPAIVFDGPTAEIDPLFSALTALSVLLLSEGIASGATRGFVLGGIVGGLAMLTKGPPYFLFVAGPALVAFGARRVRQLSVAALLVLLVALCYYGPLLLFRVPWKEFLRIASQESVGRMGAYGLENVLDIPPFLLRSLALCAPALVFAVLARKEAVGRSDPARLLCKALGAAAASGVLLLLFFPGRPTRYLLPAIALANLALAPHVVAFARSAAGIPISVKRVLAGLGIAMAFAFAVLPLFGKQEHAALLPVLGLGALVFPLVRSRYALVGIVLALPIASAWCVHDVPFAQGPIVQELVGPELERQVRERGIRSELGTHGHVPAPSMLAAHLIVPGDEALRRPPRWPFLIVEDLDGAPEWDAAELPEYRHLVRVALIDKSLVLMQRR